MYSEFKSYSFMGMSNTEIFLSENDLNAVEFDILVRPTLEFDEDQCQVTSSKDDELHERDEQEQQEEEKEDKRKPLVSSLQINLPSLGDFKVGEDDHKGHHDGFETPKSLDHIIPVIPMCPPAPRKPKSLPSTKRKTPCRKLQLLDFSKEIEALFPPAILGDFGKKIKKVRRESTGTKY